MPAAGIICQGRARGVRVILRAKKVQQGPHREAVAMDRSGGRREAKHAGE